jgi:hypothetical protein
MSLPTVTPTQYNLPLTLDDNGNFSSPTDQPTIDGDEFVGYNANCTILQGDNNTIIGSRRCTVLNGASNYIENKYNTHVIGDGGNIDLDSAFYVACTNGLHCDGDVVSFYASDQKLKDNITPISGCLNKIKMIDGVEFDWNSNQEVYSGHDIGLVAQQVQEIAPEIVAERKNGYLGVKYEKMIPILVEAIKEQQVKIELLEKKVAELDRANWRG